MPVVAVRKSLAMMLAGAGIVVAMIRALTWYAGHGTLLVSPYWLSFYVATYQDGFRRRALIGSICRMLAPQGISVFVINAIALIAAVSLLVLLARAFSKISNLDSQRSRLFGFAFFASIFGGMVFETLGDMLQITFLLFLAALLISARLRLNPLTRLVIGLLMICVAFLIHEASLFFIVPLLPFLVRHRPRMIDFILPLLLFAGLFALSIKWSHLNPAITYKAILHPASMPMDQLVETPDFKSLLQAEMATDFSSVKAVLRFATTCLRLLMVLIAGVFALAQCLPSRYLNDFLRRLGVILAFNLPMWAVAHDWGRFLVYGFLLSIVAVAATGDGQKNGAEILSANSLGTYVRGRQAGQIFSGAVLILLFCSQTEFSRITGIDEKTFVAFSLLLCLSAVLWFSEQKHA